LGHEDGFFVTDGWRIGFVIVFDGLESASFVHPGVFFAFAGSHTRFGLAFKNNKSYVLCSLGG